MNLKLGAKKKLDLMIVLELASKAVKSFKSEQKIVQEEYFKLSTTKVTNEDESGEDTIQLNIMGYLGEILVIHIVMEVLLHKLPNEKQKIINYASGKHENFHEIAKENNINMDKHGQFLQSLFERSQYCIEKILKHADIEKIQNMDYLLKICKRQSDLFEVENDSKLLDNLKKPILIAESN
nr:uncharacterized protein LOC105848902 [Hydra vulgaris]